MAKNIIDCRHEYPLTYARETCSVK